MAKILLVEDDPMISEIYQRKFEAAGFEIDIAETGKEVLVKARKEKFDIILLDLVLPELGGMDVLKEIKRSGKYDASAKVVIFSNLNEKSERDKAFELGADGFIAKSQFGPTQLVEEVKRMMGEYEEQEKNETKRQKPSATLEANTDENGNKKILFIEDEEVFSEMFGKKLEDEGYLVKVVQNGNIGLKEAINKSFDLIITDIIVPGMSGKEIIAGLKREEATKNIPIIVLSASLADEDLKKVKEMGVEDYYVKTRITPSDLVKRVKEILG